MSKTIYDVTLLDLVPPNLETNPEVIAVGKALDKQWRKLAQTVSKVLTYADIDNAPPDVVDMLAIEMKVDFYDETLPLEKRRALVKDAYVLKFLKGTAYAVKQVVTDAFDEAYIEEWPDYGGKPFHFRITTQAAMPSEAVINKIFNAVNAVKNARSHLDYLGALREVNKPIFCGFGVYQRRLQTIKPFSKEE